MYAGFAFEGKEDDPIRIGDTVSFRVAAGHKDVNPDRREWLGCVRRLWEDEFSECWLQVTWLYFPEETPGGRLPSHEKGECFLSRHIDSNTLDAVSHKVRLLPWHEWEAQRSEAQPTAWPPFDCFGCRAFYDVKTRLFRPLPAGQPLPLPSPADACARGGRKADRPVMAAPATPSRASTSSAATTPPTVPREKAVSHQSPHEAACTRLQLSAIPERLPCREAERGKVKRFLEAGVRAGSARSSLYISGMPGTGKTATVREVLRELSDEASHGAVPSFEEVWINALALSTPHQLYSTLWYALTTRNAAPARAAQLLEARFSAPSARRRPVVVVIDELDCLVTRKQTVLYNLLDWPSRRHARLVVVGIANTMDLPERMLPRVHSRLGLARVVFQPYTREQIRSIVTDRLAGLPVFRPDAVEMASRKVAALSGDVRRALHICRRAAEIAAARAHDDDDSSSTATATTPSSSSSSASGALVKITDVQAAARELSATRHIAAVKVLPLLQKVLMAAVFVQMRASRSAAEPLPGVHRRACTLLRSHLGWSGDRLPTVEEAAEMAERLGDDRLLILEHGRARWPVLRLGMQADDVPFALREDRAVSPMLD